jgi:tetraacyldisaccharide-1-P 4'-kinase
MYEVSTRLINAKIKIISVLIMDDGKILLQKLRIRNNIDLLFVNSRKPLQHFSSFAKLVMILPHF